MCDVILALTYCVAAQVLSADERHKLKLLWTPEPDPQPASSPPSNTPSSSGSSAYTSVWDRPVAAPTLSAGAFRHQAGASSALAPSELAVTLDPAAVSVSSIQGGSVLVVQQRLSVHKAAKQRAPNEGDAANPSDQDTAHVCFFSLACSFCTKLCPCHRFPCYNLLRVLMLERWTGSSPPEQPIT